MVGDNILLSGMKSVVVEKMQKITNFAKICNMPGKRCVQPFDHPLV